MNKSIDKLLFNPIRLKIISTLIKTSECDFKHLRKVTESTQGNLSIQLKKLKENNYININRIILQYRIMMRRALVISNQQ